MLTVKPIQALGTEVRPVGEVTIRESGATHVARRLGERGPLGAASFKRRVFWEGARRWKPDDG